jgi:hypothetical protein
MVTLWMMISTWFMQYDAIPWRLWLWIRENLQKFPNRMDSCKLVVDWSVNLVRKNPPR